MSITIRFALIFYIGKIRILADDLIYLENVAKNYLQVANLSFNFLLFKTSCAVLPYYSSRDRLYELFDNF